MFIEIVKNVYILKLYDLDYFIKNGKSSYDIKSYLCFIQDFF